MYFFNKFWRSILIFTWFTCIFFELRPKIFLWWSITISLTLREKCPYSELFWSAFSRIRTRITPNTDNFLRSVNVVRKNKVVALYFWNLPLSTYAKTSEKLRKCAYHRVRKVSFSKNFAHAQSSHSITFFFKCTYIKWTGTSNKID